MTRFCTHLNTVFLTLGVCGLFVLNGCSISDSVGSISRSSESSSDSSKSSSNSSGSDSKKTTTNAYESEVQDFTVTYLRTNSKALERNSFMKGISDVASQNGIVDWEANPKTYRAIGKGLRKAKITGIQYDAYVQKFSNGDIGKRDDIKDGYTAGD